MNPEAIREGIHSLKLAFTARREQIKVSPEQALTIASWAFAFGLLAQLAAPTAWAVHTSSASPDYQVYLPKIEASFQPKIRPPTPDPSPTGTKVSPELTATATRLPPSGTATRIRPPQATATAIRILPP